MTGNHYVTPRSQTMKKLILPFLLSTALFATPAPADRDNRVIVPLLKGLVFVASPTDVRKSGLTTPGVSLTAVPFLDHPGFQQELTAYIGQPLTFKGLDEITSKVSAFYKQQNHSLVDVVAPEQNVATGVIQIVVNEFRVGEVRVEGNRWFSDNVVSSPFNLQHGDTINTQTLLGDLNAANANPFRRVDLVYQPSSQTGYTDLVLQTQDRLPLSVYTGFDNSGTPVTGRGRWNLGATWGNALWHDQQLSYQFSASDNFFTGSHAAPGEPSGPSFISHSIIWSMPLRAYDSLSIFGSYQQSIPNVGTTFGFVGRSGQASIRYALGLHRTKRFNQTLQFGYDFKTTNNNLDFGGTQVSANSTEIDQFPVAYAANLTDNLGSSALTTTITFSPGGLSPDNHTSDFQPGLNQTGILGASSRYTYWRADFTRLTKLPEKAVWSFRMLGQTSSTNLLYTEKLVGGGPDLLRGYDPNSVYGDEGIVMSNELRTPPLNPFPENGYGHLQFIVFWDYAHLNAAHAFPGEINSLNASSVGPGVRYNLRSNLTARFDYGWQLIRLPDAGVGSRSHLASIALTMAY
jgi:hemolysin activation/secretion protein